MKVIEPIASDLWRVFTPELRANELREKLNEVIAYLNRPRPGLDCQICNEELKRTPAAGFLTEVVCPTDTSHFKGWERP